MIFRWFSLVLDHLSLVAPDKQVRWPLALGSADLQMALGSVGWYISFGSADQLHLRMGRIR